VIEIRRNHVLDRDLQKLDKRIGLLIKNRTTLQVHLLGELEWRGKECQTKGWRNVENSGSSQGVAGIESREQP